ncbi:unnamed protein product [Triticum turgidum subsp. durum]|uniref:NAD-dependent epimerase/dehydratase domain-containing protein n=1 Tax=Triticum turgidum subsp. durum TaxID=4567 RepID=A0A9R1P591_TRITD|nr:unnamed protein product [Triticum turgidum subsp. durum]
MASAAGDGTRRKTACVTGGNGYIASALVKTLLEKGYAVKTTVRNPDDMEKNSHLKDLQALGPLEVLRADLVEEGSFDGAVAGCDYAFLVAAPVNLYAEDPEVNDVIEPAVHGTLNVLRSCVRAGTAYPVSKVLLEKAACAFALEHGISLVTVCPVVTVGAAPAAKVNTSVPDILSLLSGDDARISKLEFIERVTGAIPMVHIDDLCRAELFLAEEKAASGRYNCGSVNTTVVGLARFLAAKYPQYNVKTDRYAGLTEKPRVCISSAKLVGEGFEFMYKTLDEIYDDVVEYARETEPCARAIARRRELSSVVIIGDMATRRKTACVTGGSGYIASALVKMLLEKGYAVKTTVRNPDDAEKNAHLKALAALGSLEVFRADLNEEGSFDHAVAGCDYAFLVAAPVSLMPENPEKDVIEPAVHGTLNVMKSCVRAGTVKRVVLTSSVAGVSSRPLEGDGHVLDEESWSDVEFLRSTKTDETVMHARVAQAYSVSKVLVEKAAMAFAEDKGISLVTVCPAVTVGEAPAANDLTSVSIILSLLSGDDAYAGALEHIERATGSIPILHIEDLCRAEMFVAEEEAASGRYIVCGLNPTAVEIARFLAANYPQYKVNTDRFRDLPEKPRVCISSAKLVKEGFEYKYKNLDGIYGSVVEYGRALGILPY